jgi:hypothetical protein
LGYYAALIGNFVPMFRDNIFMGQEVPEDFLDFLTLEDGTDMLSRNVGTKLPINAA